MKKAKKAKKMDPKLVSKQRHEIAYLSEQLGASPQMVKKAIAEVGHSRRAVRAWLEARKKPAAKAVVTAKSRRSGRDLREVFPPANTKAVRGARKQAEKSHASQSPDSGDSAVVMDDIPPDLLKEIEADSGTVVPQDKIARIREVAQDVLFKKDQAAQLAEQVSKLKAEVRDIEMKTLPDLLDEAGVPAIKLAADGNVPALEIEVKPHFAANIAAGWDEARRAEGFEYLEATGNGALIKTEISIAFDKTDHDRAMKLVERLREKGLKVEVRNSVHPATLTSWLKQQVTKVRKLPDLEKIGGFVGREAKVKLGKAET